MQIYWPLPMCIWHPKIIQAHKKLISALSFYFGFIGYIICACIMSYYKGIRLANIPQSTMQGVLERKYCSSKTGDDEFEEMVHISKLVPFLLT
jgi:hypothetical protein